MDFKEDKSIRLLQMYEKLIHGEPLSKEKLVQNFGVTPKTVQRDIESLRIFLEETYGGEIKYRKDHNDYQYIKCENTFLTQQEILGLCKILIESRAFNKSEFINLTQKLLLLLPLENRKLVERLISNERFNYIQLQHGKPLLDLIWELSNLIKEQRILHISYVRADETEREHKVKPVGLMFSEFYFYLITYIADGSKNRPTIFRLDRLKEFTPTEEFFHVSYSSRFSEAEFRKHVQYMFAGDMQKVKFIYKGPLGAVLDKLPSAEVIGTSKDGFPIIKAEVYDVGIDIWLRSQGDLVDPID